MPQFIADNSGFVLILYNLNYYDGQGVPQGVPQDVSQDTEKGKYTEAIIKMIRENPKITRAEMGKALNISMKTVGREIKKIPQLSYVGRGYSGHWKINE